MADAKQQQSAPPAPKKMRVRVVSNYGAARPGDIVEVTEREYQRLRVAVLNESDMPMGEFRFPVLISEGDAAALAKREEAERAAKMRARAAEMDGGAGWGEHEAEALSITRARWLDEQHRAELERKKEIEQATGA